MSRWGRSLAFLLVAVLLGGVSGCFGITQNPSYFPYLLPTGDYVRTHAKPIGPGYEKDEAERIASQRGWLIARDGSKWRRVVPSPRPVAVLETRVVELLVQNGVIVICCGGGGIPVIERHDGSMVGIEAVIDKDLSSALLARQLGADHLLLLTDVDAVYLDWNTRDAVAVARAGIKALDPEDFDRGSIGPKIEAAIGFAAETGKPASIGRLEDAMAILAGHSGTRIDVGVHGLTLRT